MAHSGIRTSILLIISATQFLIGCSLYRNPPPALPYDKPQEAYDFERAQRLAWAENIDPRTKYREAIAWSECNRGMQLNSRTPAQWQELGPGNIGGRVRTLVIDPVNPDRLLLGGVSGGAWRSDDGGANWRATGDSLANLSINSMAMSPANPAVVYVGTGEGYFREEVRGTDLPLRGGGIYISSDFGETWTNLRSTGSPDFYWVNDLQISSIDSRRIYAATRTGVWRSRDAGSTWSRILSPGIKGGCLDLALNRDDSLLASCGTLAPATVFYNKDAANDSEAWVPVLAEEGMGRTSLAIAPSAPNYVYALAARNAPGEEERDQALFAVFRSDRGGVAGSWTAVARGDGADIHSTMLSNASLAPTCETGAKPHYNVNMGWYTNTISVDPVNPMRVWAGGVYLFRSDDGGASWGVAAGSIHVDQHNIVFSPGYDGVANRTMYVTNDGGIYKTSDATSDVATLQQICVSAAPKMSWTALNNSLGVTQLYHGVTLGSTSVLLAGSQDNGFLKRSDSTDVNGWTEIAGGDGGYSAVDPSITRVLFGMTAFGTLLRSANGGAVFDRFESPPDDGFLFLTPMILDPRGEATIWIGGNRVWRSPAVRSEWVAATAALPDGVASALAVSPHDPGKLFVGTNSGAIYRSTSARTSVEASWAMTIPRRGFVSSIVADPRANDSLFATYSGFGGAHVWQSTDGGRSWNDVDGAGPGRLPDIPVHSIVIDPTDGDLYIATDIGVLSSSDGGTSWSRSGVGLPRVVTKWLVIGTSADGHRDLVAFTHGRGAWSMRLPSIRTRAVRR